MSEDQKNNHHFHNESQAGIDLKQRSWNTCRCLRWQIRYCCEQDRSWCWGHRYKNPSATSSAEFFKCSVVCSAKPVENNNSLWGTHHPREQDSNTKHALIVLFWNGPGAVRICTQCYRVNDKSLANKCLYCTLFAFLAALDTTVVCIVKLSREKSLNAGKRSNLKS